jgi:hypothetical protein
MHFLRDCFVASGSNNILTNNIDDTIILLNLVRGGVVVETSPGNYSFASEITKRFFFNRIFPSKVSVLPCTIVDLVKSAICLMSATALLKATIDAADFPKEAVFQHEFMSGLSASLPPTCYVCPELSKVFPDPSGTASSEKIKGEIDFYINGDLRWGIELLVKGDNIVEHMSRFALSGKYYPLLVRDYVVVDFRRSLSGLPTNVTAMAKRISVFFPSDNFDTCVCRFGMDPTNYNFELSF